MVQHGVRATPVVAAGPNKRVTFSRTAPSVKEQKNHPTQTKNLSKRSEGSVSHVQSAPSQDNTSNTGRSKRTRPHSKMTVVGASLKTRMHCNHLMPKCKCSNIHNRKKTPKAKHIVQGAGIQRRVLSSSRSLPRGEKNGRKIYQTIDESVSVCDATWRPNLDNSGDMPKSNSDNHNHKFKNGVLKKKLRFEDQVTELSERCSPSQIIDSAKNIDNKNQKQDESSSSSVQSTRARVNSNMGLEGTTKKTSADYCRLCEAPDKEYLNESYRVKRKDKVDDNDSDTATSILFPEHDDKFSSYNDSCFLCHKYRNHKCICDDDYCRICNKCINCSQEDMTESENTVHRRGSASAQVAGGDKQYSHLTKIPYEPRTKFVRNLKEKLETSFMKDESNRSRRRKSYEEPHTHHADQAQLLHHGKKCLHHYQQNDRLFLEPTITNRKGQSVCGECGAAEPKDPQREPYLYHITLGGLKTNAGEERHDSTSFNHFSSKNKENNSIYKMKSTKMLNDKSKFLYAKLNDSIDNILGGKDLHSAFSRPSAPISYPIPMYSKRNPSRSMALMDHLI